MAIWKCKSCGAIKEIRCKPKKCPQCGAEGSMVKEEAKEDAPKKSSKRKKS